MRTLGQRSGSGCKSQFNFNPNQGSPITPTKCYRSKSFKILAQTHCNNLLITKYCLYIRTPELIYRHDRKIPFKISNNINLSESKQKLLLGLRYIALHVINFIFGKKNDNMSCRN